MDGFYVCRTIGEVKEQYNLEVPATTWNQEIMYVELFEAVTFEMRTTVPKTKMASLLFIVVFFFYTKTGFILLPVTIPLLTILLPFAAAPLLMVCHISIGENSGYECEGCILFKSSNVLNDLFYFFNINLTLSLKERRQTS